MFHFKLWTTFRERNREVKGRSKLTAESASWVSDTLYSETFRSRSLVLIVFRAISDQHENLKQNQQLPSEKLFRVANDYSGVIIRSAPVISWKGKISMR